MLAKVLATEAKQEAYSSTMQSLQSPISTGHSIDPDPQTTNTWWVIKMTKEVPSEIQKTQRCHPPPS